MRRILFKPNDEKLINFHIFKTDNNNTFNAQNFQNFVTNELATEDYQKPLAADAATKCIKILQKLLDEDGDMVKVNGTNCKKIMSIAYTCIRIEFFKFCPDESQNPSKKCVQVREMFLNVFNSSETDVKHYIPKQRLRLEDCCHVENSTELAAFKRKRNRLIFECKTELSMFY